MHVDSSQQIWIESSVSNVQGEIETVASYRLRNISFVTYSFLTAIFPGTGNLLSVGSENWKMPVSDRYSNDVGLLVGAWQMIWLGSFWSQILLSSESHALADTSLNYQIAQWTCFKQKDKTNFQLEVKMC